MKDLNLALRFVLELATLTSLGFWGFATGGSPAGRVALGIGAPLIAAMAWGLFVSPRARVPLAEPLRVILGLLILGTGALALAALGRQPLAVVFGLLVALNTLLLVVWRQ